MGWDLGKTRGVTRTHHLPHTGREFVEAVTAKSKSGQRQNPGVRAIRGERLVSFRRETENERETGETERKKTSDGVHKETAKEDV